MNKEDKVFSGIAALVVALIIITVLWGWPKYRVYKQNLRGQAVLREAEWTKKVDIEAAKARNQSAELLAKAEVTRAKGVAEANKIIGDSLKENEEYLRYLYIDMLRETGDEGREVIYIPTEAGLPLLEATRNIN